jgi:hypothetical protein
MVISERHDSLFYPLVFDECRSVRIAGRAASGGIPCEHRLPRIIENRIPAYSGQIDLPADSYTRTPKTRQLLFSESPPRKNSISH